MIDPKLNEIPVPASKAPLSESEQAARSKRTRAGLSINDTVAGDTVLSNGSHGVDTSGVSAGAGAGAGSTAITPGRAGESPASEIVSGARSSGTTLQAVTNPSELADSTSTEVSGAGTDGGPSFNTRDVAERAYHIWCRRGCPDGTAEEDWHQAEHELAAETTRGRTRAAGI